MVCVFGEIRPDALTHRKARAVHVHCEPLPEFRPDAWFPLQYILCHRNEEVMKLQYFFLKY